MSVNITTSKRLYTWRFVALCALLPFFLSMFFSGVLPVKADTEVGGPITEDTTWTLDGSPYIVASESVTVTQGVTLTIEPGVVVRFNPGLKLWVDGTLIAQGTESSKIRFTSNQASPTPGNWGNIHFLETAIPTVVDQDGNYVSGSILQHCIVEYAGFDGTSFQNAVYSYLNTLMVDNCLIENNTGSGILIVSDFGTSSWVTNNTLNNNHAWGQGGGVLLHYGVIKNNIITNNTADGGTDGGGIFAVQADIIDNVVTGNETKQTSGTQGGGIFVEANLEGTILIQGNTIQGNSAVNNGGGIYINANYNGAEFIVKDNIISGNSALTNGGGIYILGSRGNATIQENVISGNIADSDADQNGSGGGIYCDHRDGVHTIQDNFILGNYAGDRGGGIFTDECPLIRNQVINNTAVFAGGGIVSSGNIISNTISANSLSGDTASGAGVYLEGSGDFLNNSLTDNSADPDTMTGGLHITGTPEVHFNNLYGNFPFDVVVEVESSNPISGTENYWGTITETVIADHIYDYYDDANRGEFIFDPFLTEPGDEAPLPPPTGLTATLVADHIELEWDMVPGFAEGWGYKVYYDTDSLLPPYEGTGFVEGASPIDVGAQTTFTLSGVLSYTDYYLGVTVYNDQGNESDYAVAVVDQDEEPLPATPSGFTANLVVDHIDLEWGPDPNFSDGWGYLVYYDTDWPQPPFEGTGLIEGDSPIDAGEQTTFTLSGIEAYTDYYLAATTYDDQGNQSDYAIAIVDQEDPPPVYYLPMISR